MMAVVMQPAMLEDLLRPSAYPHPVDEVRLCETHLSWVLLAGSYAYKIKKPVRFAFVDFSSQQRRRHFCYEELRANRPYAPDIYLDVVSITFDGRTHAFNGAGDIVESAVQMVRFAAENELSNLVRYRQVSTAEMFEFGSSLAGIHEQVDISLPIAIDPINNTWQFQQDNVAALLASPLFHSRRASVCQLRDEMFVAFTRFESALRSRLDHGLVRECHGDLHLGNVVRFNGRLCAFDCVEFEPALRWIDVMNDVGFLMMDCHVADRPDLAYAFLDGYLDRSGDYRGSLLWRWFARYRACVRAKVLALQHAQQATPTVAASALRHFDWATRPVSAHSAGRLILMGGLSGSGKSTLAQQLAPQLPAVRMRSDVLRKIQAGLAPDVHKNTEHLYQASHTSAVYDEMVEVALQLAAGGEWVLLDATYLQRSQRQQVYQAAQQQSIQCDLIWCDAPPDVLRARIAQRDLSDASDATIAVLEQQITDHQHPAEDEPVTVVDTTQRLDVLAGVLVRQITAVTAETP